MPWNKRTLFHSPSPDEVDKAADTVFRLWLNQQTGERLRDYHELQAWSTAHVEQFWELIWEYGGVLGTYEKGKLFDASFPMDIPNPNLIRATLNFAENILLSHPNARSTTAVALVSLIEPDPAHARESPDYLASTFLRQLTFAELYDDVNAVSQTLKRMGVRSGDRVGAFSPSNAEAVILCLAAAAIGAIEPKVILTADFYRYAGKRIAIFPKLKEILSSLPSVKHVLVVGQLQMDRRPEIAFPSNDGGRSWYSWANVLAEGRETMARNIPFHRGSAMAPLYVLYSSGTTGKPKAIVHSVGGMVLSAIIAQGIHNNYGPGKCLLQFSTLGWMMWNYALSAIGRGTRMIAYDGSPLNPLGVLFDMTDKYAVTSLSISPRYLQSLATAHYVPRLHHNLSTLDTIATAGSPLNAELYDWVRDNVKSLWINNGTGGTDVCSIFIGPVRSQPTYYSEIQAPALGMLVQSWDGDGQHHSDQQGEMVITKPFPNQPLGFWGDTDGSRYKAAYFEAYKQPVWTHGDWIEISSLTGGVMVFGRSDGVLNPAGVRFGSSEIYSVVEEMKDAAIEDCIAIGQKVLGGDERVLLFVKTKEGTSLSEALVQDIKKAIATALSPRHVPAKIVSCPKIPYTTNGKKLEVVTKKIINGTPFAKLNLSAAEDPEAVRWFFDLPEIAVEVPKAKL